MISHSCRNCNKDFKSWKYQDRVFCSHKCANKYNRVKNGLNEEHKRKLFAGRDAFVYTKDVRKKMSKIKKSQYRNGITPWNKGREMTRGYKDKVSKSLTGLLGDKSRNWRGGITHIAKLIRGSFHYRLWRSDVLTRDDYTCQLCGEHGGILHVDHYPKRMSLILSEYKVKDTQDSLICEELWNINNGRTLCVKCHQREHKLSRILEY